MSEEKRMAGDYEIIQAVHIGDREIVVGENQADEQGLPIWLPTMKATRFWADIMMR